MFYSVFLKNRWKIIKLGSILSNFELLGFVCEARAMSRINDCDHLQAAFQCVECGDNYGLARWTRPAAWWWWTLSTTPCAACPRPARSARSREAGRAGSPTGRARPRASAGPSPFLENREVFRIYQIPIPCVLIDVQFTSKLLWILLNQSSS